MFGLWVLVTVAVAVAGGVLLVRHLRRRPVSVRAGLAHGGLGLVAVSGLVISVWGADRGVAVNAGVLCLVLAAIGGSLTGVFRLQGLRPPLATAWLHAIAAAAGLGLLLRAWLG